MLTENKILLIPDNLLIEGEWRSRKICINGQLLREAPSQKIRNHSPDGFNWGYGGSGPAQLALGILLKYLPRQDACSLYQDFKFKVVASWPQSDFQVNINLRQIIQSLINKDNGKQQQSINHSATE